MRRGIKVVYYTNYSIEDCIGLLSRKNIYDVFDYLFEMKTGTLGEIIFIYCNKHFWNGHRSIYQIKFIKSKYTIIEVEFIKEGLFLPFPTLSPVWIAEFMEQKLNAIKYNNST